MRLMPGSGWHMTCILPSSFLAVFIRGLRACIEGRKVSKLIVVLVSYCEFFPGMNSGLFDV